MSTTADGFEDEEKSTELLKERFKSLTRSLAETSPRIQTLAKVVVRDHTVRILTSRGISEAELDELAAEAAREQVSDLALQKIIQALEKEDDTELLGEPDPGMTDYVVECRLSPRYLESVPDKGVAGVLEYWVPFSYSFVAMSRPVDEIKSDAVEAFRAAKEEVERNDKSITIEWDGVRIESGSVVVVILISGLAASSSGGVAVTAASLGAAGVAGWMATELFGGFLKKLGDKFAEKFVGLFGSGKISISDLEEQAREVALNVAVERGCRLLQSTGGFSADGWYKYAFQLADCGAKSVTVEINRSGKEPPRFTVI